jgi:hypothetical protein
VCSVSRELQTGSKIDDVADGADLTYTTESGYDLYEDLNCCSISNDTLVIGVA